MSLVRFGVGGELDELRREVNQIFSTMPALPGSLLGGGSGARFLPAMDTYERDGLLHVSMDLPGIEREDIAVELDDDVLVIRGSRSIERDRRGDTWYGHERSTGSFERSLQLPAAIDPKQVDASFDKGVLTVSMPMPAKARSSVEQIPVKSAS